MTSELVAKYDIKRGNSFSEHLLKEIIIEARQAICNRDARRFLSMREHSRGELKLKLERKGHTATIIKDILSGLRTKGLIDDSRYASNIASKTLERKPCGRSFLMATLLKKFIPREIAEKVVGDIFDLQDELELAKKALQARWNRYRHLNLETARTKAYNYLSRRGISYESAKIAFDDILRNEEEVDKD